MQYSIDTIIEQLREEIEELIILSSDDPEQYVETEMVPYGSISVPMMYVDIPIDEVECKAQELIDEDKIIFDEESKQLRIR